MFLCLAFNLLMVQYEWVQYDECNMKVQYDGGCNMKVQYDRRNMRVQ